MYEEVYSTSECLYEYYEKQYHSKFNRRCIDNSITGCNRCVGYCQYAEHPGFLTEKLRKQHNCIGNQCFHYVPKLKRKDPPQPIVDFTALMLASIRKIMCQNESVRVLRVEGAEFNRYSAYYISITGECDFDSYAAEIQKELGAEVDFINLNYDFETCAALLCAN